MRMCGEASFRWIGRVSPMGLSEAGSDAIDAVRKLTTSYGLAYMHQNPVKRGYVDEAEHWRWSSARSYAGGEGGDALHRRAV